jgi:methylmalonyl-CoA/ethylmalonyl-CoA epimerase
MTPPVLDHVAIGARDLGDGWQLFCRLLGGRWAYGADSPGYWWGQLRFAAGAKVELLTPTGGPDAAFLERFLATREAGPHHYNFIVPDLLEAIGRVGALGIEPVQVNLDNPDWKEAFLHPKSVFGIVVQLAQQAREPVTASPAELPEPGRPAAFALAEHHVDDLDAAVAFFGAALSGERVDDPGAVDDSVLLQWTNGARLRLVRRTPSPEAAARDGLHHLEFARPGDPFSRDERARIDALATRLGVRLHLHP